MKKFLVGSMTVAAAMVASSVAFAAEGDVAHATTGAAPISLIPIGVGLTLGLAAFAGAFGQGRAAAAALDGIARNPAAAGKIQVPLIVSLALMEGLTIFSWLIAGQMAGQIGK